MEAGFFYTASKFRMQTPGGVEWRRGMPLCGGGAQFNRTRRAVVRLFYAVVGASFGY